MNIRFYFDYSDYRSYLMLHTLNAIGDLPVDIQWIAVDAYSLRALSQSSPNEDSVNERAYLKQEAIRFCKQENLNFVWQQGRVYLGSALRTGIQIMLHAPSQFESYSRKIFDAFWGKGQSVDTRMLESIVKSLEIPNPNDIWQYTEQENFQFQDNCLQEAIHLGVFDVPAVVIGHDLICHFNQAAELRRLVITQWLQSLPSETVISAYAGLLLQMSPSQLAGQLRQISHRASIRQTTLAADPGFIQIQHALSIPDAVYDLPKASLSAPVRCQVYDLAQKPDLSPADSGIRLHLIVHASETFSPELTGFVKCAPCLVCIQSDRQITCICLVPDGDPVVYKNVDPITLFDCGEMRMALLSPEGAADLNLVRMAARRGAHLVLCTRSDIPVEAFAPAANAWVISFGLDNPEFISPKAGQIMPDAETVELSPDSPTKRWVPPAARTLLLCEQPIRFGEISASADMEFGCRGMNLFVTTSQQSSELSYSRSFERMRVADSQILLIPLFAEQIYIAELISHRLLETINQSPHDAVPFFISYWNALEFETLDTIRPVMAAVTTMFQIPLILVVGSQIAEIWCISPQGAPYIVEKEDDCFTVDLNEISRIGQTFDKICGRMNMSRQGFIQRLQFIESETKAS